MSKIAVVALGGNALTQESQEGTQAEQYANALVMARSVRSLMAIPPVESPSCVGTERANVSRLPTATTHWQWSRSRQMVATRR